MPTDLPDNKNHILIKDGVIQNPGEKKSKKNILVLGDKIIDILDVIPSGIKNLNIIEAEGCILTPGLIDQHIHGGYGCNFNTASVESITNFLAKITFHGITSICPTIMTDSIENINSQIQKIIKAKNKSSKNSAKIIGINLEGPFLNPKYKGAHPEELFIKPAIENYKKIENESVKIVTLAPELDKDNSLTKYLFDKKVVVSAGHTNASKEELQNSFSAGLNNLTHVFNAMPPLHHRTPGVIGVSLVNDDIYTEVIADHHHIKPEIIELVLRSKPETKIIFISDSLPLNSSNQKSTVFGGQKIYNRGEYAVNEEGKFAGSLMFLDSIIRKNINNIKFSRLIQYCSSNPAENLGLKNIGYLSEGKTADIVIWEKETMMVKSVLINGKSFTLS